MLRIGKDLPKRFAVEGITSQMGDAFIKETLNPNRRLETDMYFVWARKCF